MQSLVKKIGILLLTTATGLLHSQEFMFNNISWEQGLISGAIYDILQDEQGYLWMAGSDELAIYDGLEIKRCTKDKGWPMGSGVIYDLEKGKNNGLWVGSEDTCLFVCYNKNKITKRFVFFNEIKKAKKILFDNDNVWCFSENNLYQIRDEKIIYKTLIPANAEYNKKYAAILHNESIYIGSRDSGVIVFNTKTREFSAITNQNGLLSNTVFSVNKVGEKLLFGHENAVSVFSKGTTIGLVEGLSLGPIMQTFMDPDQNIWLLGFLGINIFDGKEIIHKISAANNHLSTNSFYFGFLDSEENIWLGGNGSGAYEIKNVYYHRFSDHNKDIDPVYGVVQDEKGTYWFGYFGVNYFSSLQYGKNGVLIRDTIPSTDSPGLNAYDPVNNTVWYVGHENVVKVEDKKTTTFTNLSQFSSSSVINVFFSAFDTSVYITSMDGVTRIKDEKITPYYYSKNNQVEHGLLVRKGTTTDNGIYLATGAGLKKISGGQIIDIPGLKEDIDGKIELKVICSDKYQSVWADIGENEILQFKTNVQGPDNYKKYNLKDLFNIEGPYNIYCKDDFFVLRSFTDVYIVELNSIYAGKPMLIDKIDQSEGLNPETAYFSELYIDHSNALWICGLYGAQRYQITKNKKNLTETINHINQIRIKDEVIDFSKFCTGYDDFDELPVNLQLPYNKNEITFEYLAVTHKGHEKVFYRTRLLGLQENWSNPFQDRHITYNNLSAGKYTFQLMSCNNDGIWNKEPYSFSFSIQPPWYQQTWFRVLMTFALAGCIYLIFLWRIRSLRKAKERQEKLTQAILESQEEERKRIARELHDGVGQELSMLKVSAEKQKNEIIEKKVNKIIEDIRLLSRNIHPHYFEKLGLTKAVEMLLEETQQHSTIYWVHELENIDGYFDTKSQLMIFRMVQECINNIIKHSEAKNAKVSFQLKPKEIRILIQDNGKGFHLDQEKLNSLGLSTIKERIKSLNGNLQIRTKPQQGTQTEITLPIQK